MQVLSSKIHHLRVGKGWLIERATCDNFSLTVCSKSKFKLNLSHTTTSNCDHNLGAN